MPALRSYQVPHALDKRAADNTLNLGYNTYKNPTFTVGGVDTGGAKRAFLSLSAYCDDYTDGCDTLRYRFNHGTTRTYQIPAERVRAGVGNHVVPVSLADLRAGSNTLQILGFPGVAANVNVYVDPA